MKITIKQLKSLIREALDREELINVYSDQYKDRYGTRPRAIDWDALTDDQIQQKMDRLMLEPEEDSSEIEHDQWDELPMASSMKPRETHKMQGARIRRPKFPKKFSY